MPRCAVLVVNTGWSGGPRGRRDAIETNAGFCGLRSRAARTFEIEERRLLIPDTCRMPGVDRTLLRRVKSGGPEAYDGRRIGWPMFSPTSSSIGTMCA